MTFFLCRRPVTVQNTTAQHDSRQIRLDDQTATQLFHNYHGFDRATVQPPHFFRKWRGQQTQFGKLLPDRTIHAVFAADNFHPRVKIIIVGYETLHHVTQQRLFLGKTEIHDYSPVPKV